LRDAGDPARSVAAAVVAAKLGVGVVGGVGGEAVEGDAAVEVVVALGGEAVVDDGVVGEPVVALGVAAVDEVVAAGELAVDVVVDTAAAFGRAAVETLGALGGFVVAALAAALSAFAGSDLLFDVTASPISTPSTTSSPNGRASFAALYCGSCRRTRIVSASSMAGRGNTASNWRLVRLTRRGAASRAWNSISSAESRSTDRRDTSSISSLTAVESMLGMSRKRLAAGGP
jgi:hypothetical protein